MFVIKISRIYRKYKQFMNQSNLYQNFCLVKIQNMKYMEQDLFYIMKRVLEESQVLIKQQQYFDLRIQNIRVNNYGKIESILGNRNNILQMINEEDKSSFKFECCYLTGRQLKQVYKKQFKSNIIESYDDYEMNSRVLFQLGLMVLQLSSQSDISYIYNLRNRMIVAE